LAIARTKEASNHTPFYDERWKTAKKRCSPKYHCKQHQAKYAPIMPIHACNYEQTGITKKHRSSYGLFRPAHALNTIKLLKDGSSAWKSENVNSVNHGC